MFLSGCNFPAYFASPDDEERQTKGEERRGEVGVLLAQDFGFTPGLSTGYLNAIE
jgi:hypothetical protein